LEGKTERVMNRDLLILTVAFVAMGFVVWSFLGNPTLNPDTPLHSTGLMKTDPNLKLVTEYSLNMRSER
jgi:hypothetical protein